MELLAVIGYCMHTATPSCPTYYNALLVTVTHGPSHIHSFRELRPRSTSAMASTKTKDLEYVDGFFAGGGAGIIGVIGSDIACLLPGIDCHPPPPPPPPPTINLSASLLESCTTTQEAVQSNTCNILMSNCSDITVDCTNSAQQALSCNFETLANSLARTIAAENDYVRSKLAAALGASESSGAAIQEAVSLHLTAKCGGTKSATQNKVSNVTCSYAHDDGLDVANSIDQTAMCALSEARALLAGAGASGSGGLTTSSASSSGSGSRVVIHSGSDAKRTPAQPGSPAASTPTVSVSLIAGCVLGGAVVWILICIGVFFLIKHQR